MFSVRLKTQFLLGLALLLCSIQVWAQEVNSISYGDGVLADFAVVDAKTKTVIYREKEAVFLVNNSSESPYRFIYKAMLNREPGAKLKLHLKPEDHAGAVDPKLIGWAPLKDFPGAKVGEVFSARGDDGQYLEFIVRDVNQEKQEVLVDANHPWAGRTVDVFIEVLNIVPPELIQKGLVVPTATP